MTFINSDSRNIVGMSNLISNEENYDLRAIEKEIMLGANITQEEEDNTVQYKQDMERIQNDILGGNSEDFDFDNEFPKITGYNQNTNQNISTFDTLINNEHMEDKQLESMTMEQQKQTYVNNALQDMNVDNELEFDIDKERDDDDKNVLLEQIDLLRDTLEDDSVNLSNVPLVNKSSNISDIKNIYKILRLKNDRNRYCSFAEELILSGAHGLEYLFDGKNEWFGQKPDLVGWNQTVLVKLRRCRFQTSTLVKDIMSDYNMGPGFQIMLELIPSLFLFSRSKRLANQDSLSNDSNYDDAISKLNSSMD